MPNNTKSLHYYPFFMAAIASIGGFLFGFNAGVISGALPFLKNSWGGLSVNQSHLIVLSILIGATIGALLSGAATGVVFLIIGRIILGAAMGISSCVVPLYISEISPANKRGALVSMFQLMITIGILVSFFSNNIIANEFNPFAWRQMFYLGTFPSILFFIGTFFLPESPRYLAYQGNLSESKVVLKKLALSINETETILNLKDTINNTQQPNKFWKPLTISMLLILITLMFIQQFVGINTIIYFTPSLFSEFIGLQSVTDISLSIGIINVMSTVFFILLIDRIGRRYFYFLGLIGMSITLSILGLIFIANGGLSNALQWVTIVVILAYIMFFAISLGPLAWLIFSEVLPYKFRAFGMSIVAFSNWFFNAIITIGILKLSLLLNDPLKMKHFDYNELQTFGQLFFVFAVIAIFGIIWGRKYLPESKGISLEEIDAK